MDEVKEKGYLYSFSYHLDEEDIKSLILTEVDKLDKKFDNVIIKVNTVKNKNEEKLGYSYIWINNEEIYNAIIGRNYDGSERIEKIEVENDESSDEEENKSSKWADIKFDFKIVTRELEPLITFPEITLDNESQIKYKMFTDSIPLVIEPAKKEILPEFINSIQVNNNIPNWITTKMLKDYFKVFERDNRVHRKKDNSFTYPLIQVKKNKTDIIFSNNYRNTASFLINMVRKVRFSNPKNKEETYLLFFRQNKRFKRYNE